MELSCDSDAMRRIHRHTALLKQINKSADIDAMDIGQFEPRQDWLLNESGSIGERPVEATDDQYRAFMENNSDEISFHDQPACSQAGALISATLPMSTDHCHLSMDGGFSLPADLRGTADAWLTTFGVDPILSQATNAELSLGENPNNSDAYTALDIPLTPVSSSSQILEPSVSQLSCGTKSREISLLNTRAHELLQGNMDGSSTSTPQLKLMIDNPDTETIAGILDILRKAKGKATISMNSE